MRFMSLRGWFVPVLGAAALSLGGCSGNSPTATSSLLGPSVSSGDLALDASSRIIAPEFLPANFVDGTSNAYFPLVPGTTYSYSSQTADGLETNTVETTHDTKTILGVVTTVIHDVVYLNGSLEEDTYDWYAADHDGNVWYFGEDTKSYDHGTLVTTAGSWEAGQNDATPGIIMLAHPQKGDTYQQENSPGIVADRAKVVALDETVTVPFGTFEHCLRTTDSTPIEPGVREYKFYAPGVGTVLEISRRGGGERVELTGFVQPAP